MFLKFEFLLDIFEQDLVEACTNADQLIEDRCPDNQLPLDIQHVLVEMVYQLGIGGVLAVEERLVLVRRRAVRVLPIHVFRRPRGFDGAENVRRGGFIRV